MHRTLHLERRVFQSVPVASYSSKNGRLVIFQGVCCRFQRQAISTGMSTGSQVSAKTPWAAEAAAACVWQRMHDAARRQHWYARRALARRLAYLLSVMMDSWVWRSDIGVMDLLITVPEDQSYETRRSARGREAYIPVLTTPDLLPKSSSTYVFPPQE